MTVEKGDIIIPIDMIYRDDDNSAKYTILKQYNQAIDSAQAGDYILYSARRLRKARSYDHPDEYFWDIMLVGRIVSVTHSVDNLFKSANANLVIQYPDGSSATYTCPARHNDGYPLLTDAAKNKYSELIPVPRGIAEETVDRCAFSICSPDSAEYVNQQLEIINRAVEKRKAFLG